MTTQPVRVKRRPPSAKRRWRRDQVRQAPTATARLEATWSWLRAAVTQQSKINISLASALVSRASRSLIACWEALDAVLPLTAAEAQRRARRRAEYSRAKTAWQRMSAAYGAVLSAAAELSKPSKTTSAADLAARAGERDRLLTVLAGDLARLAAEADGGDPL